MSEPIEPLLTPQQMVVQAGIEACLTQIDKLLGGRHVLTLVARYSGPALEDADLLMTMDTRDGVLRVLNRFMPDGTQGTDATNNPETGKEQSQ